MDIAGAYDTWAEVYDTDTNLTRDLAAAVLRRAPLPLDGRHVLEIGFTHPRTGAPVRVPAYLHQTSEYVNAGVEAGFALRHLGEWRDPGSPPTALPRLLSAHLRRERIP